VIRNASEADKARVITLLAHARTAAGFDREGGFSFPFDPAYAERLVLAHAMPRHLCLLHDVEGTVQGVLMAAYDEHPFGPVRLARETVWWIEPDYRGLAAVKMLDAYESWARANGCQFIGMAGMGFDPEVGRLYARRGFKPAERHYLKAI
jgi:Acetyltransferase (GNAT) family